VHFLLRDALLARARACACDEKVRREEEKQGMNVITATVYDLDKETPQAS